MLIAFFVVLGINLLFGWLDATHSANGIKLGLFVEGNSMIAGIYGRKPTFRQLMIFNLTQCSVLCIFAVISPFVPGDYVDSPFLMLAISAQAADAAHHIKGYITARRFGA